jgi:hypothetical protein
MLQYPPLLVEGLMSGGFPLMSLEKGSLGARDVAIADVASDPKDDFDGLFGLITG